MNISGRREVLIISKNIIDGVSTGGHAPLPLIYSSCARDNDSFAKYMQSYIPVARFTCVPVCHVAGTQSRGASHSCVVDAVRCHGRVSTAYNKVQWWPIYFQCTLHVYLMCLVCRCMVWFQGPVTTCTPVARLVSVVSSCLVAM